MFFCWIIKVLMYLWHMFNPLNKYKMETGTTHVALSSAFTTKLNDKGTLEIFFNGELVGFIYNTDDRPVVAE